jgi:putative SOS response-associated peptidase YedK
MNPGERDSLRLKSQLVPTPDDSLVVSPASSLVNNVKNDRLELLVPDRIVPVQGSLF